MRSELKNNPRLFVSKLFGIELRPYQELFMTTLDYNMHRRWARQTGKDSAVIYAALWKMMCFNSKIVIVIPHLQQRRLFIARFESIIKSTIKNCEISNDTNRSRLLISQFFSGSVLICESCHGLTCDYVFYINEIRDSCKISDSILLLKDNPKYQIFDVNLNIGIDYCTHVVSWLDIMNKDTALEKLNQLGSTIFKESYLRDID